jgi:hypothetical protein
LRTGNRQAAVDYVTKHDEEKLAEPVKNPSAFGAVVYMKGSGSGERGLDASVTRQQVESRAMQRSAAWEQADRVGFLVWGFGAGQVCSRVGGCRAFLASNGTRLVVLPPARPAAPVFAVYP